MEVLLPGSSQTRRRFVTRAVELENRIAHELCGVAVSPYTVDHASGAPAYALRIQLADRVIAYSGALHLARLIPSLVQPAAVRPATRAVA